MSEYHCGKCQSTKLRIEAVSTPGGGMAAICMTCGHRVEDSALTWALKRLGDPVPAPEATDAPPAPAS